MSPYRGPCAAQRSIYIRSHDTTVSPLGRPSLEGFMCNFGINDCTLYAYWHYRNPLIYQTSPDAFKHMRSNLHWKSNMERIWVLILYLIP